MPHLDARVLLSRAYFLQTAFLPKMLTSPFSGLQCHEDVRACDVPDMQLLEGEWVVSINVLVSHLHMGAGQNQWLVTRPAPTHATYPVTGGMEPGRDKPSNTLILSLL